MTEDLFSAQPVLCPKCKLPEGKGHTVDECREQSAFRKKARASFEALDWTPAPTRPKQP